MAIFTVEEIVESINDIISSKVYTEVGNTTATYTITLVDEQQIVGFGNVPYSGVTPLREQKTGLEIAKKQAERSAIDKLMGLLNAEIQKTGLGDDNKT